MSKEQHAYASIEARRPKAILVKISDDDSNAVWFPLHRIELNESAQTIANALLPLDDVVTTESGKAIFVEGYLDEEITDAVVRRRFYFPVSQVQVIDGTSHIPNWLAKAKAGETAYAFLSNQGSKGIDHLGGTVWQAHFSGHSISITRAMLDKARERF